MAFTVTSGFRAGGPYKTVLYGPEGIGKTLLAKSYPGAVFIDTEDSTKYYNVRRITRPDGGARPTSWTMLMDMVAAVRDGQISGVKTLVIDTIDWAETLCMRAVCDKHNKTGIEDFGYGKGYTYLEEEFGKLINRLTEVCDRGIHVVITAHAAMRRVELPEETGSYDHWEMKLEKKVAPLVKEWADIILFCNYKTVVVKGNTPMDKNKAAGGKRVMYSTHTPWWDAKNRFGLPEEMPLDFTALAHIFPTEIPEASAAPQPEPAAPPAMQEPEPAPPAPPKPEQLEASPAGGPFGQLADLMANDGVTAEQIQAVVAQKGYYPANTPIGNYDPQFVAGCLVACWDTVKKSI